MRTGGEGGRLSALAAVGGLAVLHLLLHPLLSGWPAAPHLMAGAVLVAGIRLRPGSAALVGFSLGLLEEAMVLAGPGPLAAVYAAMGYLSARSWTLLFADTRPFLPVYLVLGGWVLIVVNAWITSQDLTWSFSLLSAPAAALFTAAAVVPAVWSAVRTG